MCRTAIHQLVQREVDNLVRHKAMAEEMAQQDYIGHQSVSVMLCRGVHVLDVAEFPTEVEIGCEEGVVKRRLAAVDDGADHFPEQFSIFEGLRLAVDEGGEKAHIAHSKLAVWTAHELGVDDASHIVHTTFREQMERKRQEAFQHIVVVVVVQGNQAGQEVEGLLGQGQLVLC